jgi:hypothetical protein
MRSNDREVYSFCFQSELDLKGGTPAICIVLLFEGWLSPIFSVSFRTAHREGANR